MRGKPRRTERDREGEAMLRSVSRSESNRLGFARLGSLLLANLSRSVGLRSELGSVINCDPHLNSVSRSTPQCAASLMLVRKNTPLRRAASAES